MQPAQTALAWGSRPFLSFRYATPVPFCAALLDVPLLSCEEIAWLDRFHERCAEELTDSLLRAACTGVRDGGDAEKDLARAKAWLCRETRPVAKR